MAYTYVKKSIKGYYVTFEEELKPELFNNLGSTYEDFINDKWVKLSDEQVKFHEEHPHLSVRNVFNMEVPVAQEYVETLEDAKRNAVNEISMYDSSKEVNGFYIIPEGQDKENAVSTWFTPSERANYKNSVDSAKLLGIDNLQLFVGNIAVNVSTEQAAQMLAAIQLYADACYIVTKNHKLNVENLETIEEVKDYDYKSGYPDKLYFNV